MAKTGSYRWEGEAEKRKALRKAAEREIEEALSNREDN